MMINLLQTLGDTGDWLRVQAGGRLPLPLGEGLCLRAQAAHVHSLRRNLNRQFCPVRRLNTIFRLRGRTEGGRDTRLQ